jgi:formyltetrahydrofolate deformylase
MPEVEPGERTVLMRLLISCPDRPGIVAAVSRFLFESGANIVRSDQYSTDPEGGTFFQRMEFALPERRLELIYEQFGLEVAERFNMTWRIWHAHKPKRVVVMVSRYDHCLLELMWRWRRGELGAEIVLVTSNHPDLREEVEFFDLPYEHVPVHPDRKPEAETRLLELVRGRCDLVVLARYMQIFSSEFLDRVGVPMINIHHSFLPAFAGRQPYKQAKERGVKLVGATAHYVTEELDAGPIIEQDVIRVTHRDDVTMLARLGAEVERTVLARAVTWHCEDRILRHGSATVVF